jgi:hypothetical protein
MEIEEGNEHLEAVGSLPVMPSLLPHILRGRSQVSLFFCKCGGIY